MVGLAGFAAEGAEHGVAEEGVGAGLVAFALAAEPGDDVGVEAEGEKRKADPLLGFGMTPREKRGVCRCRSARGVHARVLRYCSG
jgi:hypothetical protein